MSVAQRRAALRSKQVAFEDFSKHGRKIQKNIRGVVAAADYGTLYTFVEENDELFEDHNKEGPEGEKGGYDRECATVDIDNIGINCDGLKTMGSKHAKNVRFQFPWANVADWIRQLGGQPEGTEAADFTRNSWKLSSLRHARYMGFSPCGFSALVHSLPVLDKATPAKKDKKKPARNRVNDDARREAERMAQGKSDEQALANIEYNQDNGQVSNMILEHVKTCISDKMTDDDDHKASYWECVIDENFATTIENMFHVSFLVKKKELALMVDRNGLPYLVNIGIAKAPRRKRQRMDDGDADPFFNTKPMQGLTSIDMKDWDQLRQSLLRNGVLEPVITEFKKMTVA